MDNDHFMQVANAVNQEYMKRVDATADVNNLNDREWQALRNRMGV
jgi:hypothetical protein